MLKLLTVDDFALVNFSSKLLIILIVVLLAEDDELCRELREKGFPVQTFEALERDTNCSVCVLPGKMLSHAYALLGTLHV